jgi:hypothetical protein
MSATTTQRKYVDDHKCMSKGMLLLELDDHKNLRTATVDFGIDINRVHRQSLSARGQMLWTLFWSTRTPMHLGTSP